jgi:hypothetical protein
MLAKPKQKFNTLLGTFINQEGKTTMYMDSDDKK